MKVFIEKGERWGGVQMKISRKKESKVEKVSFVAKNLVFGRFRKKKMFKTKKKIRYASKIPQNGRKKQ